MSTPPCPVCHAPEPGTLAIAFGATRLRCTSCSAWLVPHEGGLREEDPQLVPRLRAADEAALALDLTASLSHRRHFLRERGLSEDDVDATLAMLESALPVPQGAPPDEWLRFVDSERVAGYREGERSSRTLRVRRPGLIRELGFALSLGLLVGVRLAVVGARYGFASTAIVVALAVAALAIARLKTTRWNLAPDRWVIPGRFLGRSVSIDPTTLEWIDVSCARAQEGWAEFFGVKLRAAGEEHVLMYPGLSKESAHGLVRVLEEHAGLVPRRLSLKVRVEVDDRSDEAAAEAASGGRRTGASSRPSVGGGSEVMSQR